jgi:K(+)-stimulated pyrophosphate-energized sodium pump
VDFSQLVYGVPVAGAIALLFALWKSTWIGKQKEGTDKMKEIAGHIREGAMAFLGREYKWLAIFVVVVAGALFLINRNAAQSHWLVAVSFVVGAICSALAGYIGMRVATLANVRTTNAARSSLNQALKVAFSGGAVMGMSVVGLALIGLGVLYIVYLLFFKTAALAEYSSQIANMKHQEIVTTAIAGFAMGASSIALFARVGGGIYTKAADVGADLVGKVEAGIPEDDPRNPATIADNVGDNVGDVAGMGADLFESYVGSIVGAMTLGATMTASIMTAAGDKGQLFAWNAVMLPLVLAACGHLGVDPRHLPGAHPRGWKPADGAQHGNLWRGRVIMAVSPISSSTGCCQPKWTFDGKVYKSLGVFVATVVGLLAGVAIGIITEYYTSEQKGPLARSPKSRPLAQRPTSSPASAWA